MEFEDLVEKVVEYLRNNPYAKPSEIADYLGVSIGVVRRLLYRLRSRGLVVRTSRGYVLREPPRQPLRRGSAASTPSTQLGEPTELEVLRRSVEELRRAIDELRSRVEMLEEAVRGIGSGLLKSLSAQGRSQPSDELLEPLGALLHATAFVERDVLERMLKAMDLDMAKLLEQGFAVLGSYVVSRRALEELRRALRDYPPDSLPPRLRSLLQVLIDEGVAYVGPDGELHLLVELG